MTKQMESFYDAIKVDKKEEQKLWEI